MKIISTVKLLRYFLLKSSWKCDHIILIYIKSHYESQYRFRILSAFAYKDRLDWRYRNLTCYVVFHSEMRWLMSSLPSLHYSQDCYRSTTSSKDVNRTLFMPRSDRHRTWGLTDFEDWTNCQCLRVLVRQ